MEVRFKLTRYRVAMAALFVLAGVGLGNLLSPLVGSALATVGSTTNISDHSASAYFAKVDSSGALKTTAAVTGKVSPAAPASPWSAVKEISGFPGLGLPLAGPSTTPINLTSLTITTYAASGEGIETVLNSVQVPSSATSCDIPGTNAPIWHIADLGDGSTPQTFTFPTPLQLKPNSGSKVCLFVGTSTNSTTWVNAVGFYS
jgi:hypothetical protein